MSMPPGVAISPSPSTIAVPAPSTTSIAVHRVGVAGPADRGDAPAADADRGLADAEHRIEEQPVGDDQIHGAAAVAAACRVPSRAVLPKPVSSSSPGALSSRVDLDHQAGVAEADPVTCRRAVDGGVVGSVHAHGSPRHRGSPARAPVAAPPRAAPGASRAPSTRPPKPTRPPLTAERHQLDTACGCRARSAPTSPAGSARAPAVGGGAVEPQSRVRLEEVEVRGHGDRHRRRRSRRRAPSDVAGRRRHGGGRTSRGAGGVRPSAPRSGRGARPAAAVVEERLDLDAARSGRRRRRGRRPAPSTLRRRLAPGLGQGRAVAGGLADLVGDHRHRLGQVEPQAAGPATTRSSAAWKRTRRSISRGVSLMASNCIDVECDHDVGKRDR